MLSLFGIINLEEIKLLVGRCEAYNTKYIEDKKFNGETNQKENDADDNQIVTNNNNENIKWLIVCLLIYLGWFIRERWKRRG